MRVLEWHSEYPSVGRYACDDVDEVESRGSEVAGEAKHVSSNELQFSLAPNSSNHITLLPIYAMMHYNLHALTMPSICMGFLSALHFRSFAYTPMSSQRAKDRKVRMARSFRHVFDLRTFLATARVLQVFAKIAVANAVPGLE
jgi:hypothetical protein